MGLLNGYVISNSDFLVGFCPETAEIVSRNGVSSRIRIQVCHLVTQPSMFDTRSLSLSLSVFQFNEVRVTHST